MDRLPSNPIAIIADIHGNSDALAAVLADIDANGVDTILNLGDHLSGPLAAAETAEMILSREMVNISGNHDRYLVEQTTETMGESDKIAFEQLSKCHLDWLGDLPSSVVIADEIFMCHGTPHNDEIYWLENVLPTGETVLRNQREIEAYGVGIDCPLILCAHTHAPRVIRLNDGRLILNPGSVGLPAYDDTEPVYHVMETGSPDARYVLIHKIDDTWRINFESAPYDPKRMVALAKNANRNDWANAVSTGWFAGLAGSAA